MRDTILIASAGILAAGAYVMFRSSQDPGQQDGQEDDQAPGIGQELGQVVETVAEEAAQFVDMATMGIFRLSNMRAVTDADMVNPNVRAMLAVIRRGEGTAGANGYRTLFGGGLFSDLSQHPNQRITRTLGGKPITSTAAGAYQFLASTWQETAKIMGLADFSPANQDRGAVGRIAARGALDDVRSGRFDIAIAKIAREWASMPGSPYGQPVISLAAARATFAGAGGVVFQA